MTKTIINTPDAPLPIGPYNQAILIGETLYISGQIPIDPVTNLLISADIGTETHQSMRNLEAILTAAGMSFANVVKTTIFLHDMSLFAQVNEVYGAYFANDYPARETVAVKGLPKEARVEISMIAIK